jgi:uncharacterized OB-fold protein
VEWVDATGEGAVISRTVVRIPVREGLVPPYTVLLVELDEGPRMVGRCLGDASIGDRVVTEWEDRADEPPFPCFRAKGARA